MTSNSEILLRRRGGKECATRVAFPAVLTGLNGRICVVLNATMLRRFTVEVTTRFRHRLRSPRFIQIRGQDIHAGHMRQGQALVLPTQLGVDQGTEKASILEPLGEHCLHWFPLICPTN